MPAAAVANIDSLEARDLSTEPYAIHGVAPDGRASGGYRVVLANLQVLADSYPDTLSTSDRSAGPRLVIRNRLGRPAPSRFVYMPQNAWAWSGRAGTLIGRKAYLMAASRIAMRRAGAVVRLTSAIPVPSGTPSIVLPNVLDPKFDASLKAAAEDFETDPEVQRMAEGFVLVPGSIVAYRRHDLLEETAGTLSKLGLRVAVVGPSLDSRALSTVNDIPGVVRYPAMPRAKLVSMIAKVEAVLLTSEVEASPVTLLESLAAGKRVVAADIVANRQTAREGSERIQFFRSGDQAHLVKALRHSLANDPPEFALASAAVRAAQRSEWASELAAFLESVRSTV